MSKINKHTGLNKKAFTAKTAVLNKKDKLNQETKDVCVFIAVVLILLGLFSSKAHAQEPTPLVIHLPETVVPQQPQSHERVVNLVGEIDENMALRISSEIKSLDTENNQEIKLVITSPGGGVYAALQIVDAIQTVKSPVHTVCEGMCMSAAAVILASGTKGLREAQPHATIMIHGVSSEISGTVPQMKNEVKEAERLQEEMCAIMEKASGLSHEQMEALISFDDYLSADMAKGLGLIDSVTGEK